MPIRVTNPFLDPTIDLRAEVNPYLGKMRQAQDGSMPLLFGPALKPWAKNWRSWFQTEAKFDAKQLIVEIGCHKGEVLKNLAQNHPDKAFIGLDITFKRVVNTARKAVDHKLANLLSVLCNARALDQVFGAEELDGFLVFFPDPWAEKKRQQKNRLLDQEFFAKMKSCLKADGFIWVKTDHDEYFQEICKAAENTGLIRTKPSPGTIPAETYTSRFEMHFRELGKKTWEACWQKSPSDLPS